MHVCVVLHTYNMGGDGSAANRTKLGALGNENDPKSRFPIAIGSESDRWICESCNNNGGTDINKTMCCWCRGDGRSDAIIKKQLLLCNTCEDNKKGDGNSSRLLADSALNINPKSCPMFKAFPQITTPMQHTTGTSIKCHESPDHCESSCMQLLNCSMRGS